MNDNILTLISPFYIICNNLLIYTIINIIDYYIKTVKSKPKLKTVYKKIIAFIVSIITINLNIIIFNDDLKTTITSALLSIVFYDYIVKYIIKGVKNKTSKYNKNGDK